jgi:hypothetical protein
MTIMLDDSHITSIAQLQTFLDATAVFQMDSKCPKKERADWIYDRLTRFQYRTLGKRDKGILLRYLRKVTGYSREQMKRYISAYRDGKKLCRHYKRHCFSPTYTNVDRELLAETDNLHKRMNGKATTVICKAMYGCGDKRYERLQEISVAQLYRMRGTRQYVENVLEIGKTTPTGVDIGERRKPEPEEQPGFVRVDTVHQGDLNGQKGVYHINLVDEVIQWEVTLAVEGISEQFLEPVLKEALRLFPFRIKNFHSDNGSEYINKTVARLLNKLLIHQTKSRPRRSNDNGLVETKNGSIIRKHMGYHHIQGKWARRINVFYREHFIPYLNFHRPCLYPEVEVLPDGKKKVRYKECMTPLQKFLSLEKPSQYLRHDITIRVLKEMAGEKTPNQAAEDMQKSLRKLRQLIIDFPPHTLSPYMTSSEDS